MRTPKQWESTPGDRTSSLWSRLLCGYQLAVSLLTHVKKSCMCRCVHLGGEVDKESMAKEDLGITDHGMLWSNKSAR